MRVQLVRKRQHHAQARSEVPVEVLSQQRECISYPRQDLNAGPGASWLQRLTPFDHALAVRSPLVVKTDCFSPENSALPGSPETVDFNLLAAGLSFVFCAVAQRASFLSMLINVAEAAFLTAKTAVTTDAARAGDHD